MERITVTLDDGQAAALRRTSADTGVKVSALVRYAVSRLIADRVILLSAARTLSTQDGHSEKAEFTR
jgi:hypothetical protein